MTTELKLRVSVDKDAGSQELRAVTRDIRDISAAATENNRVTAQREVSSRRLTEAIRNEGRELRVIPDSIRRMAAAYEDSGRAVTAREAAGRRYLDGLRAEVRELQLGESGLRRYQAAQYGVIASAGPLIAQVEQLRARQKAVNDEMGSGAQRAAEMGPVLGGLKGYIAGAFSIGTIAAFTRSVVDAGIELQKIRSGMSFATGSPEAGEASYGRLRALVGELGLELDTTARSWMRLNAASQGTAMQGPQTEKILRAVATASTVLGLSAPETEGALLAISQMMSKGTVQAEELRGQLGERLPGAFQIAARAMGVTTMELGKMLEQGQVVATDFLPKFAEELEKTFGSSAKSASHNARQEMNRLSTTWTEFKQNLADNGGLTLAATASRNMASALGDVNDRLRAAKNEGLLDTLEGLMMARHAPERAAFNTVRDLLPDSYRPSQRARDRTNAAGARSMQLGQEASRQWAAQNDPGDELTFVLEGERRRAAALAELGKETKGTRTPQQKMNDEITELRKQFGGRGIDDELNKSIAQVRAHYGRQIKPDDTLDKLGNELAGLSPDYNKDLKTLFDAVGGASGIESGKGGRLSVPDYTRNVEALVKRQPFAKGIAERQEFNAKGATEEQAQLQAAEAEYLAWVGRERERNAQQEQDLRQRATAAEIAAITDNRTRAIAQFNFERELEQRKLDEIYDPAVRARMQEQFNRETVARQKLLTEELKPEYKRMLEAWGDTHRLMRSTTEEAMGSILDTGKMMWRKFSQTGKLEIKDLEQTLANMISDMTYKKFIAAPLASAADSLIGGIADVVTGSWGRGDFVADQPRGLDGFDSVLNAVWSFDRGGIMTSRGPVPLRRYSQGGIANTPQIAEFAEGGVPEAFVPVPSGKIPVELNGGGGFSLVYSPTTNIDARGAAPGVEGDLERTFVGLMATHSREMAGLMEREYHKRGKRTGLGG